MKQLDYDTSNYKYKEDLKLFITSFNEVVDKFIKGSDNCDSDLKKISANIEKKNAAIEKLNVTLVDLNNKTGELSALKDMSNEEIKVLTAKKATIAYTDSEVQKMELDDINAQISAKKGKIAKIDSKIDATKTKIKASNEEKRAAEKELKEFEKSKVAEEESLFKAQSLLDLVKNIKEELNSKSLEIVNAPYKAEKKTEEKEIIDANKVFADIDSQESFFTATREPVEDLHEALVQDSNILDEPIGLSDETIDMTEIELDNENDIILDSPQETVEPINDEKEKKDIEFDQLLKDKFEKEGLNIADFSEDAREKILKNKDEVLKNMDILKKHKIPLSYTVDQPEIFYDINAQDLDDLLSIITTDDEGNGMGFTIDFTYNILSELSHVDVDKLIDVYNEEFMNVNAKSGIIYLLKLTNPNLTDFEKNRNTNIAILRSLGTNTVDEVVKRHPEFVNMDNPLFVNVLNVFDRDDLVEKLNDDVDVVTKIIEYWKNN